MRRKSKLLEAMRAEGLQVALLREGVFAVGPEDQLNGCDRHIIRSCFDQIMDALGNEPYRPQPPVTTPLVEFSKKREA